MKMLLLLAIAVIIMVAPTLTPAENTPVAQNGVRDLPEYTNLTYTKIAKAP